MHGPSLNLAAKLSLMLLFSYAFFSFASIFSALSLRKDRTYILSIILIKRVLHAFDS